MKALLVTTGAFALMGMAQTGASVITVGGTPASSCYSAAATGDASAQGLASCNQVISGEIGPFNHLVASYVNRGILRLHQKDVPGAEADFDQAIALDPAQAEAWLNKGVARYNQGDPKTAAKLFDRAIQLKTVNPALAYFGRGLAHEDIGNIKAAYADLRRASELNPGWAAPAEELKRYRVVSAS